MISLTKSNYNPLHKIFPIIREDVNNFTNSELVFLSTELTKGGIRMENPSDFQTVLKMLAELKKEAYGQIETKR